MKLPRNLRVPIITGKGPANPLPDLFTADQINKAWGEFKDPTPMQQMVMDLEPGQDETTGKFYVKFESSGERALPGDYATETEAWDAIHRIVICEPTR